MRQHASQTEEASPSRDPAACIDRLYHRAVSRQRERAREYNEHVAMAVEKGSGKVRRSALRYHLKPEIERQLYSFPVELKRKHLEALKQAAALQPDINHSNSDVSATMDASRKKKLDSQEQMNLGQRLCNESLAHKQAVIKELQQRAIELPLRCRRNTHGGSSLPSATPWSRMCMSWCSDDAHEPLTPLV